MINQTVVIADDHEIITDGLHKFFEKHFTEVSTCSTGLQVIEILKKKDVSVLILDLNIPGANGLDVLKFIKDQELKTKVVILTMYNEATLVEKCRKLGAHGYLLKTSGNQEVFDTTQKEAFVYGHGVKNIHELVEFHDEFIKSTELTTREIEVIRLLAQDYNSEEIANKLFVSQHTVNTHRRNLKKKLNVSTTAGLISFGFQNNLIID